ncbi:MAG: hypothetical protein JWL70_413 [Acidimicrobiia bacterium]|nr:hypothetical protein [Acidimicrobiia bacterium]
MAGDRHGHRLAGDGGGDGDRDGGVGAASLHPVIRIGPTARSAAGSSPGHRTINRVFPRVASPSSPAGLPPLYARLGLITFCGLIVIGVAERLPDQAALTIIGAIAAVVFAVPLFLAQPRLVAGCAVGATTGVALLANTSPGNLAWFAICVAGGWCVLRGGVTIGVLYWAASLLLFAGEWRWAHEDPAWGNWAAGVTCTFLGGLLVRHERSLVDQLRTAQTHLAEQSRAEERNRIARELHDVIAHSLTVSLLHVSSARLAVEHDPTEAARALGEAERLTRQSLAEVRATVGLLHSPGDHGSAPPVPGIGELGGLIDDLRAANANVSLVLEGDVAAVAATSGSTAYRIVQESLTNATRHAPGAPVVVRVTALPDRVDVSIESSGRAGQGVGMGLVNMRERAEAVGGTCTAGPQGSGWLVHASLPRTAEAAVT